MEKLSSTLFSDFTTSAYFLWLTQIIAKLKKNMLRLSRSLHNDLDPDPEYIDNIYWELFECTWTQRVYTLVRARGNNIYKNKIVSFLV